MLFVLSGGGTAGHINPALALTEELTARGHDVRFAGTPTGVEARLVPAAGVEFAAFEASGFNRSHPATIVRALRLIQRSTHKAQEWFSSIDPDCVVGFGGYVCIPVARAANKRGIPVVVHEQNSVMGLANKALSLRAVRVALTYEAAGAAVSDRSKIVLTGNPVRRSVFDASREEGRDYCGVAQDATLLTVFGGSLGARHINTAVAALKDGLLSRPGLFVRHITGPKEFDSVVESLSLTEDEQRRWQVVGYEDQMGRVLAASDCVVSRAGATSLAEISALQIPALLVPYPHATADHQTANARSYVDRGAAYLVADDDVEGPEFAERLFALVDDAEVRASMRAAAATFETRNASARLADVVIDAALTNAARGK
ncbi:MAG: undecaprenyldiphospho-muramoylpentapeptide beta-N-acetylglucosaminyltransferase [Eggerthellaceae bacterium]|nr:undecaprenyldiphospho-muramoylpentapeptide beta-N-acetylglucosaminyltransferase [Eggerthellaceae bacterium]